jgi:hypothetical protein
MSRLRPCRILLTTALALVACRYEPLEGLPLIRDAGVDRSPAPVTPDATAPVDTAPAGEDMLPTPTPTPMPMPMPDVAGPPPDVAGPPPDAAGPAPDVAPMPPSACQNTGGMQTACANGDGCCPSACNASNDGDCAPRCGNGVVERGESCEPVAECNRRQAACHSDAGTIRTPAGSAAACTFHCNESPRPCGPADGQCPPGCGKDPDCLPRPSSCVHIEWCKKPFQPGQGLVICQTADDGRCTDAERIAECAREASSVCGAGHARPIQYVPAIGGRTSG